MNFSLDELTPPIVALEDPVTEEDGVVVLPNVFLAASENGCVVSRVGDNACAEAPWKLSVPRSILTWGP